MRSVRNEDVKIESKNKYVETLKKVMKITLIIVIICLVIGKISYEKYDEYFDKRYPSYSYYFNYSDSLSEEEKEEYERKYKFYRGIYEKCLFIGIGAGSVGIISLLIYIYSSKMKIVVTDKRVYGRASFGREIDLPFDSISAISKGILKGIAVATSSGRIRFILISNRDEIYSTISDLLLERQNKKDEVKDFSTSNTEEIKKYKDLLDNGIITQEEFDKKKKELLGL